MASTIRRWLRNENVTHIAFPQVDSESYGLDAFVGIPEGVFPYDDPQIQPWLDVVFDTGFGTAHVPYFIAWSEDNVYHVDEYDGSTQCAQTPRNPSPIVGRW